MKERRKVKRREEERKKRREGGRKEIMASYIMRMILNGVLIGTLELTMLVNSLPQVHTYFENQPIIP